MGITYTSDSSSHGPSPDFIDFICHRILNKLRGGCRRIKDTIKKWRAPRTSICNLPLDILQQVEALLPAGDKTSLRATSLQLYCRLTVRANHFPGDRSRRTHETRFILGPFRPPAPWSMNSSSSPSHDLCSCLGVCFGSAKAAASRHNQCIRPMPLCPHRSLTKKDWNQLVGHLGSARPTPRALASVQSSLACQVPTCRAWTRSFLGADPAYPAYQCHTWDLYTIVRCLRVRVALADVADPSILVSDDGIRARTLAALSALDLPICQHLKMNNAKIANALEPFEGLQIDDTRQGASWSRQPKGRYDLNYCCSCCLQGNIRKTGWRWFCQVVPAAERGTVWFDFNICFCRSFDAKAASWIELVAAVKSCTTVESLGGMDTTLPHANSNSRPTNGGNGQRRTALEVLKGEGQMLAED